MACVSYNYVLNQVFPTLRFEVPDVLTSEVFATDLDEVSLIFCLKFPNVCVCVLAISSESNISNLTAYSFQFEYFPDILTEARKELTFSASIMARVSVQILKNLFQQGLYYKFHEAILTKLYR
jgi:hypothetical protein